jgi:hypothetical protein
MDVKSKITGLALVFALAGTVGAQTADQVVSEFEGTFRATGSEQQARAEINEQIDEVVDKMNFIKRPFARSRLKEATKPCVELSFEVLQGNNLNVKCDERPDAVAPISGQEGSYTNEEGNKFVLVYKVGPNQILQAFADQDGLRKNLYTLSPDGDTVTMEATIESKQLPEPVTFERTFQRE